jgi:Flp pilus assembly protein TadD
VRYARQAAEQALAYGAPRAAAAQYTRAIEAAGHLFRTPSWDLHCGRACALQQLGDIDGALTEYATALDGARMARNEQAERIVMNKLAGLLPSLPQAHASDYYLQIAGDVGSEE